jgi:hypothetical protein
MEGQEEETSKENVTFRVPQREDFAFAFTDVDACDGGDAEVVAAEGEDFLFHLKSLFGWLAELGEGAEGRVEGCEVSHDGSLILCLIVETGFGSRYCKSDIV